MRKKVIIFLQILTLTLSTPQVFSMRAEIIPSTEEINFYKKRNLLTLEKLLKTIKIDQRKLSKLKSSLDEKGSIKLKKIANLKNALEKIIEEKVNKIEKDIKDAKKLLTSKYLQDKEIKVFKRLTINDLENQINLYREAINSLQKLKNQKSLSKIEKEEKQAQIEKINFILLMIRKTIKAKEEQKKILDRKITPDLDERTKKKAPPIPSKKTRKKHPKTLTKLLKRLEKVSPKKIEKTKQDALEIIKKLESELVKKEATKKEREKEKILELKKLDKAELVKKLKHAEKAAKNFKNVDPETSKQYELEAKIINKILKRKKRRTPPPRPKKRKKKIDSKIQIELQKFDPIELLKRLKQTEEGVKVFKKTDPGISKQYAKATKIIRQVLKDKKIKIPPPRPKKRKIKIDPKIQTIIEYFEFYMKEPDISLLLSIIEQTKLEALKIAVENMNNVNIYDLLTKLRECRFHYNKRKKQLKSMTPKLKKRTLEKIKLLEKKLQEFETIVRNIIKKKKITLKKVEAERIEQQKRKTKRKNKEIQMKIEKEKIKAQKEDVIRKAKTKKKKKKIAILMKDNKQSLETKLLNSKSIIKKLKKEKKTPKLKTEIKKIKKEIELIESAINKKIIFKLEKISKGQLKTEHLKTEKNRKKINNLKNKTLNQKEQLRQLTFKINELQQIMSKEGIIKLLLAVEIGKVKRFKYNLKINTTFGEIFEKIVELEDEDIFEIIKNKEFQNNFKKLQKIDPDDMEDAANDIEFEDQLEQIINNFKKAGPIEKTIYRNQILELIDQLYKKAKEIEEKKE